jgi:hypothetical protein
MTANPIAAAPLTPRQSTAAVGGPQLRTRPLAYRVDFFRSASSFLPPLIVLSVIVRWVWISLRPPQ